MGASPDAGRATAGLPALSPSLRFETDHRTAHNHKQQTIAKEVEAKADAAVAPDADRDRTSVNVGYPLTAVQLIHKLTTLCPSLDIRHHPTMPRFQVFVRDTSRPNNERYVCAFEDQLSPEFEVLLWHWEEHVEGFGKDARLVRKKVLDSTVRGWRTLLAILIRERIISKAGADKLFGTVNSCNWQRLVGGH